MHTTKKLALVSTLIAANLIGWPVSANAEDLHVPPQTTLLIRGGVLCDTEDELTTLITAVHLNGGQWPEETPAGCGQFMPEMAVPMLATPLYWYETPSEHTLVTRFVYLPNGWTQYGYMAVVQNPEYKPPLGDGA